MKNGLRCRITDEKLTNFANIKIALWSSLAGAQLLTSVSRKRRSALFFLMFLRRTDTATLRTKITTMKRTPITPAAIRGVLKRQKKGRREKVGSSCTVSQFSHSGTNGTQANHDFIYIKTGTRCPTAETECLVPFFGGVHHDEADAVLMHQHIHNGENNTGQRTPFMICWMEAFCAQRGRTSVCL